MSQYDLRTPCGTCPFRVDVKYNATGRQAERTCKALARGEFRECIEKPAVYNQDGIINRDPQMCAGAVIVMKKMKLKNDITSDTRSMLYDMTANVFQTFGHLVQALYHMQKGIRPSPRIPQKPRNPSVKAPVDVK